MTTFVKKQPRRCEHGRRQNHCKECGGKGICEHGKIRHICKECCGASICGHGRRRRHCKDCVTHHSGGTSICKHGREQNKCKECGGSSICEHGRRRSECKDCNGASICGHGRRRSECKDCNGASICGHGRRRRICKECDGKGICEHGRERDKCKDCIGEIAFKNRFLCKSEWCYTYRNKKYKGYCRLCFMRAFPDEPVARNYKIKEQHVVDRVKARFPEFTWVCDKRYDFAPTDCASRRRPDMFCHFGTHVLIVEVDEN